MNLSVAPVEIKNQELINRILEDTRRNLNINTSLIKLDFRLDELFSAERKQYFSTGFLNQAIKQTGDIEGKILIITELDIYVPVLTFLFGEAQLNGKHSIVSFCRLHEEFYSEKGNKELFFERALKEVYHELGHNYGLIHCHDWDCVMHSSNSVEEVDIKGHYYCSKCISGIEKENMMNLRRAV
jgi:archaemetzincin